MTRSRCKSNLGRPHPRCLPGRNRRRAGIAKSRTSGVFARKKLSRTLSFSALSGRLSIRSFKTASTNLTAKWHSSWGLPGGSAQLIIFTSPRRSRRYASSSAPSAVMMGLLTVGSRIGVSLTQRRDGCACAYRLAAEIAPCLHQSAAFLESVAAAVGLLDFVTDSMCQRSLADLAWEVGALPAPVAESAAHPVNGCFIAQALEQFAHRSLAEVIAALTRKYEFVPLAKLHFLQNGNCPVA